MTIRALEAGKAVLCEKPIANTLEDAREMLETAERLQGWLQIGFELRYSKLYTLTWDAKEDHSYYHNTTDQTRDVVRRVVNGLPPMTPAGDAYDTMRLCFAAEVSADAGGAVRLDDVRTAAPAVKNAPH
jgi:predicted dehydrogenase